MVYGIVVDGVCANIIEAGADFAATIGANLVPEGFGIGDIFKNGIWSKGLKKEPIRIHAEPTELELTQQEITELQLNDIEQGQTITELELLILGGTGHV